MFPTVEFSILMSLLAIWLVFWYIMTVLNRDQQLIIKRGVPNTLLFSFTAFGSFFSNVIGTTAFIELRYTIPCPIPLYLNYICTFGILYSYFSRAVGLIYEKHINMIMALSGNEVKTKSYLEHLNWLEKRLLRSKELIIKLEADSNKATIIQTHLNLNKLHKPKNILKYNLIVAAVSSIVATLMLMTNIDYWTKPFCPVIQYVPLYAAMIVIIGFSVYLCYLLRTLNDPFYLKIEFVIVMGIVVPVGFLTFLGLRLPGIPEANVLLLLIAILAHFTSIVIPNILAFRIKRHKDVNKRSSTASVVSLVDIKQKAAERFCLELALFKEDYDATKALKSSQDIELACMAIYQKYLVKNAPQELNLSSELMKKLKIQFENRDFTILDQVYDEVKVMLYQNLNFTL